MRIFFILVAHANILVAQEDNLVAPSSIQVAHYLLFGITLGSCWHACGMGLAWFCDDIGMILVCFVHVFVMSLA